MTELSIFRNEETQRTLADGETLFALGDPANAMYGVVEGAIEIIIDDEVVERVEAGGILGEMAILDSNPRSATARAAGDTVVAEINERRFLSLVKVNPFFSIEVMRVMSERIRRLS